MDGKLVCSICDANIDSGTGLKFKGDSYICNQCFLGLSSDFEFEQLFSRYDSEDVIDEI